MTVKSCENLEKSQVALTVEVGAAEFETALEKAFKKVGKTIKLPGFRPGKAPRKVIEGMLGADVFFEEAVNIVFPDAYEAAVKEHELKVVGNPKVEMVGECTREGFTFKAIVPIYPDVTLGEYKGLSAVKRDVKVMAADVNARLKEMGERNSRLVKVDRASKDGDTVVIDFLGKMNGKEFEGGKSENYSLELGSHSFIPGFEEQVVGMKADEEKDLDLTFPANYPADMANQPVTFRVKVHEVKEKEIPALDDEFAKDVSDFDTLKELKADLKKKITAERKKSAQSDYEEELMMQVADNITADIPDAMIEAQTQQFVENLKSRVAQMGIPLDEYLTMTGNTMEKVLEDSREPAEKQVRLDLALAAIIKEEDLSATDEEVEEEYKRLAEEYDMELDMVKKFLPAREIQNQLNARKAVAVVTKHATAIKPEKEAAEKEKAESNAEEK